MIWRAGRCQRSGVVTAHGKVAMKLAVRTPGPLDAQGTRSPAHGGLTQMVTTTQTCGKDILVDGSTLLLDRASTTNLQVSRRRASRLFKRQAKKVRLVTPEPPIPRPEFGVCTRIGAITEHPRDCHRLRAAVRIPPGCGRWLHNRLTHDARPRVICFRFL